MIAKITWRPEGQLSPWPRTSRARSHPAGRSRCTTTWPPPPARPSRIAAASRSRLNSAAAAATRGRAPITPDNSTVHTADTATRPVIDPAEHGHIRARTVRFATSTPHTTSRRAGGGHRRVVCAGTSGRPGPGPPQGATCPASAPGQPGPRRPGSRPSGCTCRHRCHTCRNTTALLAGQTVGCRTSKPRPSTAATVRPHELVNESGCHGRRGPDRSPSAMPYRQGIT